MFGRNLPRELYLDSLNGRRYYTLSECAKKLKVDRSMLNAWVEQELITCHHKSMTKGIRYFDLEDIKAIIKKLRDSNQLSTKVESFLTPNLERR